MIPRRLTKKFGEKGELRVATTPGESLPSTVYVAVFRWSDSGPSYQEYKLVRQYRDEAVYVENLPFDTRPTPLYYGASFTETWAETVLNRLRENYLYLTQGPDSSTWVLPSTLFLGPSYDASTDPDGYYSFPGFVLNDLNTSLLRQHNEKAKSKGLALLYLYDGSTHYADFVTLPWHTCVVDSTVCTARIIDASGSITQVRNWTTEIHAAYGYLVCHDDQLSATVKLDSPASATAEVYVPGTHSDLWSICKNDYAPYFQSLARVKYTADVVFNGAMPIPGLYASLPGVTQQLYISEVHVSGFRMYDSTHFQPVAGQLILMNKPGDPILRIGVQNTDLTHPRLIYTESKSFMTQCIDDSTCIPALISLYPPSPIVGNWLIEIDFNATLISPTLPVQNLYLYGDIWSMTELSFSAVDTYTVSSSRSFDISNASPYSGVYEGRFGITVTNSTLTDIGSVQITYEICASDGTSTDCGSISIYDDQLPDDILEFTTPSLNFRPTTLTLSVTLRIYDSTGSAIALDPTTFSGNIFLARWNLSGGSPSVLYRPDSVTLPDLVVTDVTDPDNPKSIGTYDGTEPLRYNIGMPNSVPVVLEVKPASSTDLPIIGNLIIRHYVT